MAIDPIRPFVPVPGQFTAKASHCTILFVCGSLNQTTQMHQIAKQLPECSCYFTPYFCDGALEVARRAGLVEFTILGQKLTDRCLTYLRSHNLPLDIRGTQREYDLVVTCSDLVMPARVRRTKVVLVQEGMTDPENWLFHIVKRLTFLPRWLASTSTTGLSDAYEAFCVASDGYRTLFVRKGCDPARVIVTGIPNFDNCIRYAANGFPYHGYVLVCTSDSRETFKYENRRKFISSAVALAAGRQLIFKLHPNENVGRAIREIRRHAPGALVYPTGSAEEMIANCEVLITHYSSTALVGLALGKEVYADASLDELRRLVPVQHGKAARNIAEVCRMVLYDGRSPRISRIPGRVRPFVRHVPEFTMLSGPPTR